MSYVIQHKLSKWYMTYDTKKSDSFNWVEQLDKANKYSTKKLAQIIVDKYQRWLATWGNEVFVEIVKTKKVNKEVVGWVVKLEAPSDWYSNSWYLVKGGDSEIPSFSISYLSADVIRFYSLEAAIAFMDTVLEYSDMPSSDIRYVKLVKKVK